MSFSRRVRSMAVLIGEASEVARGRQGQKWVGQMVWEHHVSMTPRTEVSVCERETIGERKKKLLGSEIVTELEVGQFFWGKMGNRTWVVWGRRVVFAWLGSGQFRCKWLSE